MPPAARDPDLALGHADYVRALVRELVFDPELAADVEQETWLAALQHAPRDPRFPRAWLKRLVRNFAFMAWRSEARRGNREERVARERGAVPTPAEILEREALRREIVEAVLALGEPVRSAMVLHYLEQRSLPDVAAELGVPLETVRSRVKRGLELLRARMERRDRGPRGAWSVALVELWRLEPASYARVAAAAAKACLEGAMLMGVAQKVGVAVAAAAVIGAAWWFSSSQGAAERSRAPASIVAAPDAMAPADRVALVDAGEPSREAQLANASSAAETTASEIGRFGSLLVRVVYATDASPACDVGLRVYQSGAADYYGDSLTARTGASGSVVLDPVIAGTVTIEVDRGGYALAKVTAGERAEATVEIAAGVDVEGRTLDPSGRPVGGAEVYLYRVGRLYEGHVVARSERDGRYAIRDVEGESLVWISARARGWAPTRQVQVMASTSATARIDLAFEDEGGRVSGRVTGPNGEPIAGAKVLIGDESAFRQSELPNGLRANAPAAQLAIADSDGRFAVEGVAAGTIPVQVRARGFAPWLGEARVVERGEAQLEIALSRGATLAGVVRGDSGQPIARAVVHAGRAHEFASSTRVTGADGVYAFDAVPLGDLGVLAERDELGSAETTLLSTEGAALRWDPVLSAGATLRGRVVAGAEALDAWYVRVQSQDFRYLADAKCAVDGRFELADCPRTPLRVEVYAPTSGVFPVAVVESALAGAGDLVIDVDEAALPSVRLRGRVVDESGAPVRDARVNPCRAGATNAPIELVDPESGRFDLGPYPPGTWSIRAEGMGLVDARTDPRPSAPNDVIEFGDVVLERGGTVVVRLDVRDGLDPEGVWIRIRDERGTHRWLEVDGDRARSGRVPSGRNVLEVSGAQVGLAALEVDVRPERETLVDLALRRGLPVDLRIRNEDGRPLASRVRARVIDERGVCLADEWLAPTEGGVARSFDLAPGRYRADAADDTGAIGVVEFTVDSAARDARTFDLVLRPR